MMLFKYPVLLCKTQQLPSILSNYALFQKREGKRLKFSFLPNLKIKKMP
jgi:hypothetical protein